MSKESNDAWVNAHYGHDTYPVTDNKPAAAPGIDLEQFRALIDLGMTYGRGSVYRAAAMRMQALLDASPKGGSDAEVLQLRYQLNSLRQLLSGFDVAVQNNPLQPPCTYLEEVRLSHEFQPGEGQKVAAALRNALNSKSEGAKS